MSTVSLVKANGSSNEDIKQAIISSLNLIDFKFNENVKRIVIKPNMCYYYHPSTGEVTDPAFISALIDVLKEKYACPEIFIVESDASAMKCQYAFRMFGYDKIAKEQGVNLINLCQEKSNQTEISINGCSLKFGVPELLVTCDLLINVPKIKYMKAVKITCALKNIFGCNAVQKKSSYHKFLDEAIVGINKLVKTNLVLVDGLMVNGKNTKQLNLVMAGEDLVAVDSASSRLLGLNPSSIRHLTLASKEGLGSLKFNALGDFAYFQRNFPKKTIGDKLFEYGASMYLRTIHR